ncbi:winged helix-turn-helix domain-containing protein [Streptomyces sp. P9(2023)]|uniref:ArsR/SmtB family transcription factor n=1 Tax=Streptomyces sp. P9(2023) TaxID=3064394 RepID=UPI0028F4362F|nr:winged helix-turn-helix domain-containing protein [Streptomyces sp. P9(2023)]MDT9689302.1 winged helix-turn-helix domain-containing protein [Streptomyces sp. P9(2023)]
MIRIRFAAEDFARVRFAARPAPVQELNAAFMMMFRGGDDLLFGRWRRRVLRSLPEAAAPLADLVPAGDPPRFLDVLGETLTEGLDLVGSARPELVRSELERVYAGRPSPPWIRDLHAGGSGAGKVLRRAQRAAFETIVAPVWPLVQDLHRAEFTRQALTVAEHGVGAALPALVPGTRLRDGVWEWPASGVADERAGEQAAGERAAGERAGDRGAGDRAGDRGAGERAGERDIPLAGRGLVLLPTFHWTGHPLVHDLPGRPVTVTYAAGPGLPLTPDAAPGTDASLAAVLGRTRLELLRALTDTHTTTSLARRLGISNATASAHASALRGAGLITTVRAGRAVEHRRTALGALLVGPCA